MNGKIYPFLFLLASFIFIGCKTASRLYEKGNYDEAVELAVKNFRKNQAILS
ncbi:MAG: hypothetical protein HC867_08650 [Bacteroidia bacterium]|nr:hypothetical protein [Bacteroidia bacterium]